MPGKIRSASTAAPLRGIEPWERASRADALPRLARALRSIPAHGGPMARELVGKKVAMLVGDGFEQVEMTGPKKALEEAGAQVDIVSFQRETVRGWKSKEWGDEFRVDRFLPDANVADYDALVLPGGVINADKMRGIPEARELVRAFLDDDKPIAAICHAPWLLIDADVVVGRRLTSWPTLEKDLENAGADWVDDEVVVDGRLVTSRKPDDIPAFNEAMIRLFRGKGEDAEPSKGDSVSPSAAEPKPVAGNPSVPAATTEEDARREAPALNGHL